MSHNPLASLGRQVQAASTALEHVHHSQAVLVMPEMGIRVVLAIDFVEGILAHVAKGCMAHVMGKGDGLGQLFV